MKQISADIDWEEAFISHNTVLIQTSLDFLRDCGGKLRLLQEPGVFIRPDINPSNNVTWSESPWIIDGWFIDSPSGVSSAIQMSDPTSVQNFNPFASLSAQNTESCVLEKAEARGLLSF